MDVVYAVVVDHGGYAGVVGLRFALAVAFYAGLGLLVTRAGAAPAAAFVVALVVGLPAFTVLQDRPQTVSLLFILVLSAASTASAAAALCRPGGLSRRSPGCGRTSTDCGSSSRCRWCCSPCVGSWSARIPGSHPPDAIRLAAVAVVSAACTPIGPRLFLSVWRVPGAAGSLIEWQADCPDRDRGMGADRRPRPGGSGVGQTTDPSRAADVLCCVAWVGSACSPSATPSRQA